jgi:hypothetical protein
MPARTDLTDALLALIPEDGSRLSNEAMALALAAEVEEPFSPEELEAAKAHVVAMGAAEKAKGPGGGLRAAGVSPPPKAMAPATERRRRSSNGAKPVAVEPTLAPGTTAATALTGELRNQIEQEILQGIEELEGMLR